MAASRGSRGRQTAAPETPGSTRRCRACGRELRSPADLGWECECGVVVCPETACLEEFFKSVAGGEATRCLSCGLVS